MKYAKQKSRLFGQIDAASGAFSPKLIAELRILGNELEDRRQAIDAKGRFLFELDEETTEKLSCRPIEIAICSPHGEVLASKVTRIPKGGFVEGIRLLIPGEGQRQTEDKSSLVGRHRAPNLFTQAGISARRLTALARVLEATGAFPGLRVPAWINQNISDIDEASWIAHRILDGEEALLPTFARLLEHSATSRVQQLRGNASFPLGEGFGRRCFVPPAASFNVSLIGLLLEEYDPENEWAERTINYVSERVQPLNHLFEAALLVGRGELPPGALMARMGEQRSPTEPLTMPGTSHETPVEPTEPSRPGRRPPGGLGFPAEDLCQSYWRDCIRDVQRTGLNASQSRPKTTDIGGVEPSVACGGQEVQVTIRPKQGLDFGSGPSGSTLRYAEKQGRSWEVDPDAWAPDGIEVRLPVAAHSGRFYFERSFAWHGLAEGCSDLLLRGSVSRGLRLQDAVAFVDKFPRLDPGEELHNEIELVQPPVIESFTADGSDMSLVAEACTPVTVAWRVAFGNPATAAADNLSLDRIQVSVLEDSAVIASGLDAEGSMEFDDRETRVLTLKAEAKIGDTVCGEDLDTLTIARLQRLHLTLPTSELEAGTRLTARVSRSCALSSETKVALSASLSLISVPDTVVIPAGQRETTFEVEAAPSGCAKVSLLAEAPGHQFDKVLLFVYEKPTVSSFSPQQVTACTNFDLQITGTCFAAGETRVFVSNGTETHELDVLSLSADGGTVTARRVEGISPGDWSVQVRSRGLPSAPFSAQLRAVPAQPRINEFKVYHPLTGSIIEPCINQDITLEWDVQYGSRLTITDEETGEVVEERMLTDACGRDTGTVLHTVNSGRSFKLDVFSHDPSASPETQRTELLEQSFGAGNYSSVKFTISDLSDDTFALWYQKLNVAGARPELVGTASADGEITHSLDDCDKYLFRLLSQAYVDDHNSRRSSIDNDLTITDADDTRAFQHQSAIKAEVLVRGRSSVGAYAHGDVL